MSSIDSDDSMKKVHKWGFGMSPLSDTMRARYSRAVNAIICFLRDQTDASDLGLDAISELKGMFNRSLRKDQWDWFTVFERLGCPPRNDMQYFVRKLAELRKSLGDDESEVTHALKDDLANSTILHYLDQWQSERPATRNRQSGWLYVLSTKDEPDILKIGMTTRTVSERVKEINSATGVLYPYSARAVYRVRDARAAERRVFKLLSDYRVRQDREFFEIAFPLAARMIERELSSENALKRKRGIITWFDSGRGYGFIRYLDQDVFVHISSLVDQSSDSLDPGQEVEFDLTYTTKGMAATDVTLATKCGSN